MRQHLPWAFPTGPNELDVLYWGILSDSIRTPLGSNGPHSNFIAFNVPAPQIAVRTARDVLRKAPLYSLQNLAVWDAQQQRPARCSAAAGPWRKRCGNIFPNHVKELVIDHAHDVYAHVVWRVSEAEMYLTKFLIHGDDLSVVGMQQIADTTEIGLPREDVLRQLQWYSGAD